MFAKKALGGDNNSGDKNKKKDWGEKKEGGAKKSLGGEDGSSGTTKKACWATQNAIRPFADASGKIVSVLLSASVERFGLSRIQDFHQLGPTGPSWS